jgi:hypothetical protein
MKRRARIASGKLRFGGNCPNCLKKCDGATGVTLNGAFAHIGPTRRISIQGSLTMCCYCGALLVFADQEGRLRVMTAEERSTCKFDPVLEKLIDDFRREKVQHPPNFTRKNFN